MEAIAKLRHLKGSPRKARLVIDLIRGRNVAQALSILKFTNKRAALPIAKCLSSAIANATYLAEQQNIAIDPDGLWIDTCFIDMGPTKNRRRVRPAPQGRAYREQRHYCHITIHVTSDAPPVDEKATKAAEARAKRAEARKVEDTGVKEKLPNKVADAIEEIKHPTETPNEEIGQPVVGQTEEVGQSATPNEAAEMADSKGHAEIADAKNVASQTPAEMNETQPADEAQQKINEDLERQ